MTLRPIAIAAVLFAAASAQAALTTTTYVTAPAVFSFNGADDLSIPGFQVGDSISYAFTFDADLYSPYYLGNFFLHDMTFSVSAGDLTISTVGDLRVIYRSSASYPVTFGMDVFFTPTGPTIISGSVMTSGGLVDASSGAGSVDIEVYRGAFYSGPFVYGLYPAPGDLQVHETGLIPGLDVPGHFDITMAFSLGANTFDAFASGIRPVPEPSTYGLWGAGVLLGAALVRRRLIRS